MNIKAEGNHAGEHLLSEGNGQISRESVMIASGDSLPAGQLLGIKSSSGQYAPYSNAATDGSEIAVAILYAPLPASSSVRPAVVHVRLCEMSAAKLVGLDAAARADLMQRSIILR